MVKANIRENKNIPKAERPVSAKAQLVKKKSDPVPVITPIKIDKKAQPVRPRSNYRGVQKAVVAPPIKSPLPPVK